jgi:Sulfotransferase domain
MAVTMTGDMADHEPQPASRFPAAGPLKEPPAIPDGWSVAPPDFVGVGAQRSGTTWWYSVISSHPDVDRPPGRDKEVHFFDNYCGVETVLASTYHRYFPRSPGKLCGEWTPRYMYDYWAPPMLRAAAPETKVLVILRDPVKRFLSGLTLNTANGFEMTMMLLHHQFGRGLYWSQLSALLEHFPRSQLLVLQHERCVADPVSQATRTFEFLGLDPYAWKAPADIAKRVNASTAGKPAINETTLATIRLSYQAELGQLFADFPEIDPTLWPSAA